MFVFALSVYLMGKSSFPLSSKSISTINQEPPMENCYGKILHHRKTITAKIHSKRRLAKEHTTHRTPIERSYKPLQSPGYHPTKISRTTSTRQGKMGLAGDTYRSIVCWVAYASGFAPSIAPSMDGDVPRDTGSIV